MTRNLRAAAAAVATAVATALLLAVPASAGSQGPETRYSYALGDTGAGGGAMNLLPLTDTPAGRVAVAGTVLIVPSRSSFTLHFDDKALVNGQRFRVQVYSGAKPLFEGCVPVRSEKKITGAAPGGRVSIYFGHYYGLPCGAAATAGVLTVSELP